jgi:hypothetical protein
MNREYLRVIPTFGALDTHTMVSPRRRLSKLTVPYQGNILGLLRSFGSWRPIPFEFLAISEGKDESLQIYYEPVTRFIFLKQCLHTLYSTPLCSVVS